MHAVGEHPPERPLAKRRGAVEPLVNAQHDAVLGHDLQLGEAVVVARVHPEHQRRRDVGRRVEKPADLTLLGPGVVPRADTCELARTALDDG